MPSLIEISNLHKHFRGVKAVDGVSLGIAENICFGLLGPNGAGKTTTVEMLEGISAPDSGHIRYKGAPLDGRFRLEAGIMFQSTALQEYITVSEALEMFRRFYPRPAALDALLERFHLRELADRETRKLSGGQRQRLLLAVAMVNDPEVVFLDEPTTGLDPQARRNLWELVEETKARGKTIILTTHYMEEAYILCDEIAIMDRGRIIAHGAPSSLLAEHFDDVVLQLPKADFHDGALDGETVLDCRDSVEILTRDVNGTVQRLLAANVALDHLQIRPRTLDDLFLELTGKELRT